MLFAVGVRFARGYLGQCASDFDKHALDVLCHLLIPKPDNSESFIFQNSRARVVVSSLPFGMLLAGNLDDQPPFNTREIDDIATACCLRNFWRNSARERRRVQSKLFVCCPFPSKQSRAREGLCRHNSWWTQVSQEDSLTKVAWRTLEPNPAPVRLYGPAR